MKKIQLLTLPKVAQKHKTMKKFILLLSIILIGLSSCEDIFYDIERDMRDEGWKPYVVEQRETIIVSTLEDYNDNRRYTAFEISLEEGETIYYNENLHQLFILKNSNIISDGGYIIAVRQYNITIITHERDWHPNDETVKFNPTSGNPVYPRVKIAGEWGDLIQM